VRRKWSENERMASEREWRRGKKRGREEKRTWMTGTGASSPNMSLNGTKTPWSGKENEVVRKISSSSLSPFKNRTELEGCRRTKSRSSVPTSILSPRLELRSQPRTADTGVLEKRDNLLSKVVVAGGLELELVELVWEAEVYETREVEGEEKSVVILTTTEDEGREKRAEGERSVECGGKECRNAQSHSNGFSSP
jgi:hypothetical protein